jgi:probable HAF family extracellular repeat protein
MTTKTNLELALGVARKKRRKLPLLFLLGFVCSTVSAAVEITDLGTLGGEQSFALAINDSDQVVGESRIAGDQEEHIFMYDHGQLVDISKLNNIGAGDYFSQANDISNLGQIAANIPNGHAAILTQGMTTDLGTFGGIYSSALGINDSGQAVGYYSLPGFLNHAFSYAHGIMTALGPFGVEATSIATGINDLGMIVGNATDSYTVPSHAFLYAHGAMTDISPFGSSESYAHGINNRGEVVGEYLIADHTAFHAFLYSGGMFTEMGAADSPETVAYDINDRGKAVGSTWVRPKDSCRECNDFVPHAFVYENGVMTDLNTLLPSGSEWELVEAFAINNKGNIVGYGSIHGQFHAFMLSWSRFQSASAAATHQDGRRMLAASLPHR